MSVADRIEGAREASGRNEESVAVQALVSRQLGCPLRLLAAEDVTKIKPRSRPRRYIRYDFQKGGRDRETFRVLTRAGVSRLGFPASLGTFLSGLSLDEFRAPTYFGLLEFDAGDPLKLVHVWELVADASRPTGDDWVNRRREVVLAAAAMTVVSGDVRREVPELRPAVWFIQPVSELVEKAIEGCSGDKQDLSDLSQKASMLARLEGDAIGRFKSLGGYFTHNDYTISNVLLNPEKPVVVDWDGASLGAPGASLRGMAKLPEATQAEVVELYCAHLASKGLALRAPDVLFAMRAAQVFHALTRGAQGAAAGHPRAVGIFRWGLDHLDYLAG